MDNQKKEFIKKLRQYKGLSGYFIITGLVCFVIALLLSIFLLCSLILINLYDVSFSGIILLKLFLILGGIMLILFPVCIIDFFLWIMIKKLIKENGSTKGSTKH